MGGGPVGEALLEILLAIRTLSMQLGKVGRFVISTRVFAVASLVFDQISAQSTLTTVATASISTIPYTSGPLLKCAVAIGDSVSSFNFCILHLATWPV